MCETADDLVASLRLHSGQRTGSVVLPCFRLSWWGIAASASTWVEHCDRGRHCRSVSLVALGAFALLQTGAGRRGEVTDQGVNVWKFEVKDPNTMIGKPSRNFSFPQKLRALEQ